MADIIVAGNTSGAITISAPLVAGSGVLTLPTGTDTLVGKATTDTLTNKSIAATQLTGTIAAAALPAGSVLQAAFISQDTMISTSVTMNYSNSLPTITQGAQILSQSFTPIKASSTLFFFFNTYGTSSNTSNVIYALFEDSTCISAIAPRFTTAGESGWATVISRSKAAVSTTARTYSVRFGGQPGNAPTCTVNSYPIFAGAPQTTIMILEIAA